MNIEPFRQKLYDALIALHRIDSVIFTLGHHEPTINHQLACKLSIQFAEHIVDCEYALAGTDEKQNQFGMTVRPDIVIHQIRGQNTNNLAVIEVKRHSNSRNDKQKIEDYSNLGYKFGVRIKFTNDGRLVGKHSGIYVFADRQWCPIAPTQPQQQT